MTAQSKAPADTLLGEIDAAIAALADQVAQFNHLMSQSRQANVAAEPTLRLQEAAENMRKKILSCQGDAAMLREAHASVLQMQPMAPVGMGNDPMAAASMQQPPMNMPPGMNPMASEGGQMAALAKMDKTNGGKSL